MWATTGINGCATHQWTIFIPCSRFIHCRYMTVDVWQILHSLKLATDYFYSFHDCFCWIPSLHVYAFNDFTKWCVHPSKWGCGSIYNKNWLLWCWSAMNMNKTAAHYYHGCQLIHLWLYSRTTVPVPLGPTHACTTKPEFWRENEAIVVPFKSSR